MTHLGYKQYKVFMVYRISVWIQSRRNNFEKQSCLLGLFFIIKSM